MCPNIGKLLPQESRVVPTLILNKKSGQYPLFNIFCSTRKPGLRAGASLRGEIQGDLAHALGGLVILAHRIFFTVSRAKFNT